MTCEEAIIKYLEANKIKNNFNMYKDFATGLEQEHYRKITKEMSLERKREANSGNANFLNVTNKKNGPSDEMKKIMKMKSINRKKREAPNTAASICMFNSFVSRFGDNFIFGKMSCGLLYVLVQIPMIYLLVTTFHEIDTRIVEKGEAMECANMDLPMLSLP